MYKVLTTNKLERDIVICHQRGLKRQIIDNVIELLSNTGKLPLYYKPHKLSGTYSGYWECHLQHDWLLIWKIDEQDKSILLIRTGTHSDLF